jgi:AcrR family transcriptional regulator
MYVGDEMPRNKYPEETVSIILEAAQKVFIEKGYENTTILDIVSEMKGLTRGAFYHHFKSKEEVLLKLNEKLFLRMNPFEKARGMNSLNGLEKVKWLISHMHGDEEFVAMQIELAPLLQSPAMLKKQVDSISGEMAPRLCEFIEEGMADGSIKAKNPKLTAELFFLLTSFWPVPASFPTASREEEFQKLEMIAELCAHIGLPVFDDAFRQILSAHSLEKKEQGGTVHE